MNEENKILERVPTVDNFRQITKLLNFESEDDFYFMQILKRKKENKELGSNSHVVKTYYIKNIDDLEKDKEEMIMLAELHNARVCINLNKRSFERMAFNVLKKITDQLLCKDFKNVRKAYNSACGDQSPYEDKTWIVDIDEKGRVANNILSCIDACQPEGNKLIAILPTKNGVHLITKPFNLQQFKQEFPNIDIHKNNPTVLYMP